jgi:hypothetical protein
MSVRASLVPRSEIRPERKALYDAFSKRVSQRYSIFKTTRVDGALLGPWAVWLQVPKTGEAIRQLIETIEAMPGLKTSTVQAIILATGARFNAAYELYAHSSVAATMGLSDSQIATLSVGGSPTDLDEEAKLAIEVTHGLLRGGVLPGPLFKRAINVLGQDGFDHLIYIVSQYCLVSICLNAYDVPAE